MDEKGDVDEANLTPTTREVDSQPAPDEKDVTTNVEVGPTCIEVEHKSW